MPKKIDEELKARAVRLVNDHQGEYSSLTAAAAVVAGVLIAGAIELLVLVMDDPMLLAAKPMYQVPAVIVASYLGWFHNGMRDAWRALRRRG